MPLSLIHTVWKSVEGYLEGALAFSGGDYTIEQVKVYVSKGEWVLVVALDEDNVVKGAATANIFNMPNDRIAFVTAIGGKHISTRESFAQLKNIFKGFGATKIQGAARESIARLWKRFDFEERYRIVEVKI